MRRFMKTYNILGRKVFVHLVAYDDHDMHTAMCSGLPFKEPQYVFLDYDDNYEPEEWEWITKEYSYKRSLAVESSPKKYWFLTFSPTYVGQIAEIMFHSHCDKNHAQYLLKDGFVGIRLSSKKRVPHRFRRNPIAHRFRRNPMTEAREGYPRIIKEIVNMKGTNFYNWDMERVFKDILKNGGSFTFDDVRIRKGGGKT
jgi:hypothetical protein